MKVLSVEDLTQSLGLNAEQRELLDWSVLVAGNELSRKILGRAFPHPDLCSTATLLALYQKEPTMAANLLQKRAKLPLHAFMRGDPQERLLEALVAEHHLKISFKECTCEVNPFEEIFSDNAHLVCQHCHGLIDKRKRR